jgi:hypothetical protein
MIFNYVIKSESLCIQVEWHVNLLFPGHEINAGPLAQG